MSSAISISITTSYRIRYYSILLKMRGPGFKEQKSKHRKKVRKLTVILCFTEFQFFYSERMILELYQ